MASAPEVASAPEKASDPEVAPAPEITFRPEAGVSEGVSAAADSGAPTAATPAGASILDPPSRVNLLTPATSIRATGNAALASAASPATRLAVTRRSSPSAPPIPPSPQEAIPRATTAAAAPVAAAAVPSDAAPPSDAKLILRNTVTNGGTARALGPCAKPGDSRGSPAIPGECPAIPGAWPTTPGGRPFAASVGVSSPALSGGRPFAVADGVLSVSAAAEPGVPDSRVAAPSDRAPQPTGTLDGCTGLVCSQAGHEAGGDAGNGECDVHSRYTCGDAAGCDG
eukprot:scaffold11760_cov108-Isochrysis_galbana.AAC.2